jgi:hypothetical protein
MRSTLLCLFSTLACIAQVPATRQPRSTIANSTKAQAILSTAEIAKRVSPAVVVVLGKTGSGDVLGSGLIISKDGKIVTNFHVIQDMQSATVELANGSVFESVFVLAEDKQRDLAILQVAGKDLPVLEMGNSDLLRVGDSVVVVGSPRGLEGTVTAGILSSVRDSGEGYSVLQTDAAVNPGNSGGPLVNGNGVAVGVVSFSLHSAQGLNFAIPINYVQAMLTNLHEPISIDQLRRHLAGAPSGPQQSGAPSLKETLDWLKEKLSLWGRIDHVERVENVSLGISYSFSAFYQTLPGAFDSCTVTLTQRWGTDVKPPLVLRSRSTVPLGLIIDSRIDRERAAKVGSVSQGSEWHYVLSLKTKLKDIPWELEREKESTASDSTPTPPSRVVADSVGIPFDDESLAKRVQEAFKHAADLCRSKEPF